MNRKHVYAWLALLPLLSLSSMQASAATWAGVRDGVFHIRVTQSCSASTPALLWTPAWIARSQHENIYFQSPNGSLIKKKHIAARQTQGRYRLAYERDPGDYRLEVPGYSYRNYQLETPDAMPVVFEPVKVHFSMSVPAGQSFYFRVPAGKRFTLGGKYHEGVSALHIEPVKGGARTTLPLRQDTGYADLDRKTIAARTGTQVWRLSFEYQGKVSFWLDGVPNLFALKPELLFQPDYKPGVVSVAVGNDVIGDAPRVGASLDFALPSAQQLELMRAAKLEASSLYFLEDALTRDIERDVEIIRTYERVLEIEDYVSLLSRVERGSLSDDIRQSLAFTAHYLRHHRRKHGLSIPYIALVDEPNLRYQSFEAFEKEFTIMAEGLEHAGDDAVSSTKISAPESSRMLNGPPLEGAKRYIGLDWTRRLLERHWPLFDAISWHEWLVRDLVATDLYAETIEQVWDMMVAKAPANARLKELMITQTNMSGGLQLSPYEQDTFFAALWWTSVVAQSTNTGKLAMLNWFKALNYPPYEKGIMKVGEDGQYALKPVGHAMAFIHPAVWENVLRVDESSVELDMAATRNDKGAVSLLGVNKATRRQRVTVTLEKPEGWRGEPRVLRGSVMGANLVPKPLHITSTTPDDTIQLSFELEPQTLWTVELSQ